MISTKCAWGIDDHGCGPDTPKIGSGHFGQAVIGLPRLVIFLTGYRLDRRVRRWSARGRT